MLRQKVIIDPMVPYYQRAKRLVGRKKKVSPPASLEKAVKDSDQIQDRPIHNDLKKAEKEGAIEAMKESVKEHRKNTFKFFGLVNKSERLIYRISNIIPFLTGEVLIDTAKVTFIFRPFFFSERIHSISVKDISDVYIETVPFFGTINIVDTNFSEKLVSLNWFWKRDAEKARRIITGLMEASKEQIDLKNIEEDDLAQKLEEIGKLRETTTSVSKA